MDIEDEKTEGEKRRDEGIATALENEDPSWIANYYKIAYPFFYELEIGDTFKMEDIHAIIRKKFGEPHVPQVWSGTSKEFLASLSKECSIERVDFVKSTMRKNNASQIALYKRLK